MKVLLAMALAWFICFILTVAGAFPDKETEWGYYARTDIKLNVLSNAKWISFPYPGKQFIYIIVYNEPLYLISLIL